MTAITITVKVIYDTTESRISRIEIYWGDELFYSVECPGKVAVRRAFRLANRCKDQSSIYNNKTQCQEITYRRNVLPILI